MPDNTACHQILTNFCAFQCTGSRVIDLRPTAQTLLEFLGAFADVMGIPQQFPALFCSEPGCKISAEHCSSVQMFLYSLRLSVLSNVCKKHRFPHPRLPKR